MNIYKRLVHKTSTIAHQLGGVYEKTQDIKYFYGILHHANIIIYKYIFCSHSRIS